MFSFFLDLKLPLRCIYKKNREARDMYVNVENVNFAYDKKPILHDINFGMNKGEITGLIRSAEASMWINRETWRNRLR